jgi:NAD(P)-dependent dehydrogenase (short-subunit alcohol dehydrogenase family)
MGHKATSHLGPPTEATGRIDVVFANAGYAAPAPLASITEEHVDGLLNTNVKGVIWTVQKALPLMGPGSSIILSSSIVGSKGFGNWSIYSATKAAVRSFARTWASDLKGRNIRFNAVSPGDYRNARSRQIRLLAAGSQRLLRFRRDVVAARPDRHRRRGRQGRRLPGLRRKPLHERKRSVSSTAASHRSDAMLRTPCSSRTVCPTDSAGFSN